MKPIRMQLTIFAGFNKNLAAIFVFAFIFISLQSQQWIHPYRDLTYPSKVFGHNKTYRLYLPKGYHDSTLSYPVIYFFHGWGGRYNKDDNAKLEYDKIGKLVNKYQVILVMWDGNIEESEPRPYNIGYHKDIKYQVQMKDYFPELVSYIDSNYRTLDDRNHRGIIGFSMGGIMSFYLAGKYPDKVCAAVNLAGTPEFYIGYPDNHTLYPVRYTFKNLMDVDTRQQGGDSDILVYLNEEVKKGAEWEGNPYEFWGFHGGHMVDPPGETRAFEMAMSFVAKSFQKVHKNPDRWSHYDLYDAFDVWGYSVASNKKVPGYIYMKNVDKSGFGFYTQQWLPDGPPVSNVKANITTAPIYVPGAAYNILAFSNADKDTLIHYRVACRYDKRLTFQDIGNGWEYGIYTDLDAPELIALDYEVKNHGRYLVSNQRNQLSIRLFNRAGEIRDVQKLVVTLKTADSAITIHESVVNATVNPLQRIIQVPSFDIACTKLPPAHGEPFQVKFKITVQSVTDTYQDEVVVPVLFDAPLFTEIKIDDGVIIRDKAYGNGNANGIAEAGEHVMLYNGDHRLRLYTDDPWVIAADEKLADEQIPSVWEDSYALSSIVEISKDCPDGHVIEFSGDYETNTYNPIERNLHWGKIRITVSHPKVQ